MALNQSVAEEEIQVALIRNKKKLSSDQKHEKIRMIKSSSAVEKTTSAKTIMSITNTMIGSSVIVYPVLFIQDGLLSSSIMMLVVGMVQYWTCRILCLHNKQDENDVNDTINRILGPKWYKANLITNVLLLYIVCIVYFLLIAQNFYDLTSSFIAAYNPAYVPPKMSTVTFDVYSSQWAGIIVMIIIYPLLFIKKIDPLLRFLKVTAYGVLLYMVFVLVFAFKHVVSKQVDWGSYVLFSKDFSNVAGAFALSFIIHPVVSPILKKNMQQQNNNRDLFLGYLATAGVYAFVGLFGALACGKSVKDVISQQYSTIFQCFPNTQNLGIYIVSKIVQLCIMLQNMSVFPILSFLTRKQFVEIFDKENPRPGLSLGFTLSLITLSLLVQVLSLNVTAVISFDGAIIGFVLAYLIPIYMHWKCMYHEFTPAENEDRRQQLEKHLTVNQIAEHHLESSEGLECVPHPPKNKRRDTILYSSILVFGVAMGIFKIYNFISPS